MFVALDQDLAVGPELIDGIADPGPTYHRGRAEATHPTLVRAQRAPAWFPRPGEVDPRSALVHAPTSSVRGGCAGGGCTDVGRAAAIEGASWVGGLGDTDPRSTSSLGGCGSDERIDGSVDVASSLGRWRLGWAG